MELRQINQNYIRWNQRGQMESTEKENIYLNAMKCVEWTNIKMKNSNFNPRCLIKKKWNKFQNIICIDFS